DSTCIDGVSGILSPDGYCCTLSCGTCGGGGCHSRPGGVSSCCGSQILSSGVMCDESEEAPCIVDEAAAIEPT
ncbi:unnamed protein product, partial [Hapterophycus canaliculatus]